MIREVLNAPGMIENLASIRQFTKNGFHVNFVEDRAKITNANGHTIIEAKIDPDDDLYKLQARAANDERACIGRVVKEDMEGEAALVARTQKSVGTLNLWHRRLAHLNEDDVMRMYSKGMVEGMEIIPQSAKQPAACGPCHQGKQTREPIPKDTETRATEPLYRIHSDLCDVGQSS